MCMFVSGGQEDRIWVKTNLLSERLLLTWYTKCNHAVYWNATVLVGKKSLSQAPFMSSLTYWIPYSSLRLPLSPWTLHDLVTKLLTSESTGSLQDPGPVLQLDSILKFWLHHSCHHYWKMFPVASPPGVDLSTCTKHN